MRNPSSGCVKSPSKIPHRNRGCRTQNTLNSCQKEQKNAGARQGLSLPYLLTCSGAQQEDKDGLLTEVLNGKVSLFTPDRPVQPLVAVALPKQAKFMFLEFCLCSHLLSSFSIGSLTFYAKSSCLDLNFIRFDPFVLFQLNLV